MKFRQDKGAPLTEEQKVCLVELIKEHPAVLDKNSDHPTILRKQVAWDEVTRQYNRIFPTAQPKTGLQLKRAFEYLKIKARKADFSRVSSRSDDTTSDGQPHSPPKPDKLTLMVMELILREMKLNFSTLTTEDPQAYLECTTNLEEGDGTIDVKYEDDELPDSPAPQQEANTPSTSQTNPCATFDDPATYTSTSTAGTTNPAVSSSTAPTSSTNSSSIPTPSLFSACTFLHSTLLANTSPMEEQEDNLVSNNTAPQHNAVSGFSDDEYSSMPEKEKPATRKRKAETEREMARKRLCEDQARLKENIGNCFERELVKVSDKTVEVLDTLKNVIEMVGQAMVRNMDKIGEKFGNK